MAKAKLPKHNGYVLYEGPSRIDKQPIVAIATGLRNRSTNTKTGAMVQTYILRSDLNPMEALATGADVSVCGACTHRPKQTHVPRADGRPGYAQRSCYVRIDTGPLGIYKAYKRGRYPKVNANEISALFTGRVVRLGAYGDPAAVPLAIWQLVTANAESWTGYTHQWKAKRLRDVTALCQASVDSVAEVDKIKQLGLGYFRVRTADEPLLPGEIVCPASAEAGKVTQCDTCRMCDGKSKLPITIIAHGAGARHVRALPTLATV